MISSTCASAPAPALGTLSSSLSSSLTWWLLCIGLGALGLSLERILQFLQANMDCPHLGDLGLQSSARSAASSVKRAARVPSLAPPRPGPGLVSSSGPSSRCTSCSRASGRNALFGAFSRSWFGSPPPAAVPSPARVSSQRVSACAACLRVCSSWLWCSHTCRAPRKRLLLLQDIAVVALHGLHPMRAAPNFRQHLLLCCPRIGRALLLPGLNTASSRAAASAGVLLLHRAASTFSRLGGVRSTGRPLVVLLFCSTSSRRSSSWPRSATTSR